MTPPATLIAHPNPQSLAQSVRAKAVIFADPKSQLLLQQIERIAPSDAAVLVIGDTGTGKELVARHIHEQSGRTGPFVAVNCGALSQSLAEAELFGHQAGAFTGASETRAGWFEAASGGTLFLDEIGDLPLPLQVKLLRVLQEKEVVRVGSRKPIALNLRLIAATNVDLANAVTAGHFRIDLYYRLNVVRLELPPLRERRGDILPLVDFFLTLYSTRLGFERPTLSPQARSTLLNYAWPGNIRELENVMHFALLFTTGGIVQAEHLRFSGLPLPGATDDRSPENRIGEQLEQLFASPPDALYSRLEELIVARAYQHSGNNQVRAARLLGISRNILRTQLKRFGLIGAEAANEGFTAIATADG